MAGAPDEAAAADVRPFGEMGSIFDVSKFGIGVIALRLEFGPDHVPTFVWLLSESVGAWERTWVH